jgi:hypothetical protein
MNDAAPFQHYDLAELDDVLLSRASRVVPACVVARGYADPSAIMLRHDVDDNEGSFDAALALASWEAERGYSSTYYLLHTARYWGRPGFTSDARQFECLGHEVGIHADAIGDAVDSKRRPEYILAEAIAELRGAGVDVTGVAAHGNSLCRAQDGSLRFVNDELFTECARPECGPPSRTVLGVHIDPMPLASYGLSYAVERLPHGWRLSDSGGVWSVPPREWYATAKGQLHFLMHPDWWTQAL